MPVDTPSAHDVAKRLIEQAPDEEWLRTVVDDLDQRIRTRPLERLLTLWSLSAAQGAELFGISRQAFMKWLKKGPPAERAEAIAALAAATDLLAHHLKRERIAAVVRRQNPQLSGKSLLELASAGEYTKVRSAVEMMFGWCRRTERRLPDELDEIGLHCSSLRVLDRSIANEIVGYDENGLPRGAGDC